MYDWAVNFAKEDASGEIVHTEVVLVNASTGMVAP